MTLVIRATKASSFQVIPAMPHMMDPSLPDPPQHARRSPPPRLNSTLHPAHSVDDRAIEARRQKKGQGREKNPVVAEAAHQHPPGVAKLIEVEVVPRAVPVQPRYVRPQRPPKVGRRQR